MNSRSAGYVGLMSGISTKIGAGLRKAQTAAGNSHYDASRKTERALNACHITT
jgi:hypothetical protein